MPDQSSWQRWGRFAAAAALGVVVGWHAFIAHREVPFLDQFDLGMHEVGHLLAAFTPRMVMFLAGSAMQIAVPLGLAWYFGIRRGDAAGGGFCLAWAGTSAWDVSVYIADARVQALPLIGGGQHDWGYLLGANGWDVLHLADEIARAVAIGGALLVIAGIGVAVWGGASALMRRPSVAESSPVPATVSDSDPWLEAAKLPFKHEAA